MKKSKLTSKPPPKQNLTTFSVRYKYKHTSHLTH